MLWLTSSHFSFLYKHWTDDLYAAPRLTRTKTGVGKVHIVHRLQPGQSLRRPPCTYQSRKTVFLVIGQSNPTNLSSFYSCHRDRLVVEGSRVRKLNSSTACRQPPASTASLGRRALTTERRREESSPRTCLPRVSVTAWRDVVSLDREHQPARALQTQPGGSCPSASYRRAVEWNVRCSLNTGWSYYQTLGKNLDSPSCWLTFLTGCPCGPNSTDRGGEFPKHPLLSRPHSAWEFEKTKWLTCK